VVVADDGLGMMPRTDSPGLGLGLPVITTVSDRMEVVSEGAGTELHIAFRLSG
jgi:serine/threonine-protein kinase RsbW/stage II sporulation protein AB (anti-sigma F factor)